MVGALERTGLLDNTWIIYTSDHGEMAGSHGLMSKCVLYEGAVRVPLIVRPPGGCAPRRRRLPGGAPGRAGDRSCTSPVPPTSPDGEGRSLLAAVRGESSDPTCDVTVSENWGFAAFETGRYKLVVDEDALAPCQLFDLLEDPAEDHDLLADPLWPHPSSRRSWRPTCARSSGLRRPAPTPASSPAATTRRVVVAGPDGSDPWAAGEPGSVLLRALRAQPLEDRDDEPEDRESRR